MNAVKQLMAVLRIVPTLMVHTLAAATLATVLAMMGSPAMVFDKFLWPGLATELLG